MYVLKTTNTNQFCSEQYINRTLLNSITHIFLNLPDVNLISSDSIFDYENKRFGLLSAGDDNVISSLKNTNRINLDFSEVVQDEKILQELEIKKIVYVEELESISEDEATKTYKVKKICTFADMDELIASNKSTPEITKRLKINLEAIKQIEVEGNEAKDLIWEYFVDLINNIKVISTKELQAPLIQPEELKSDEDVAKFSIQRENKFIALMYLNYVDAFRIHERKLSTKELQTLIFDEFCYRTDEFDKDKFMRYNLSRQGYLYSNLSKMLKIKNLSWHDNIKLDMNDLHKNIFTEYRLKEYEVFSEELDDYAVALSVHTYKIMNLLENSIKADVNLLIEYKEHNVKMLQKLKDRINNSRLDTSTIILLNNSVVKFMEQRCNAIDVQVNNISRMKDMQNVKDNVTTVPISLIGYSPVTENYEIIELITDNIEKISSLTNDELTKFSNLLFKLDPNMYGDLHNKIAFIDLKELFDRFEEGK